MFERHVRHLCVISEGSLTTLCRMELQLPLFRSLKIRTSLGKDFLLAIIFAV